MLAEGDQLSAVAVCPFGTSVVMQSTLKARRGRERGSGEGSLRVGVMEESPVP